jgi:trigger factor
MIISIKKLPKSEIEIEGEHPYDELLKFESEAIKNLGENLELPGFRKGHIPKDILVNHVGNLRILEEMAGLAMSPLYMKILEENKIEAIGRPEIVITKIAKNNPLGFKIKTAVLPEIKLADYRGLSLAAKHGGTVPASLEVTDEELESAILEIRKMRSHKHDHGCETGECEHEDPIPRQSAPARRSFSEGGSSPRESAVSLPELTDEYVKQLGSFTSVEDFKSKLRDNIKLEKEARAREQKRVKILDKIIEKTEIDLPEILINAELDKMIYKLKGDIETAGLRHAEAGYGHAEAGLEFENYLKQINKTEEDMRKEWTPSAEKRAKLGLVLEKIATAENIKLDPSEVEREVSQLIKVYPDADPNRAKMYVENIMTNEKVFQLLENVA